ncbi:MAG: hypothetical protein A2X31_03370 [Elusimicrobia bacterium GWB2_63_22]|nr:MAG: hypothetical protein A2X31_03370 [Elusimicrobia bacterium GWB2_63_22]
MNNYNENKEKKGGFLSSLSGLFRGGSSAMGGASSSGLGSAGSAGGGLAGLFATKAGIVGMVLGGATIAAGVGVVYNFIGPSSSGVYSPELFQNTYYEEESNRAGLERSKARDASGAASSTLDMFREQARKDGLGGLAGEAGDAEAANAAAEDPSAADGSDGAASADAPSADGAPGAGGAPKLQAASGFGGKAGGGGSGTSIPRMQGGGGLAGGIGAQFQPVYRAPAQANAGKSSGMLASGNARITRSPKYAVPNFKKKGAFGQAKYAGNMSKKAASYSGAASASAATDAMIGETTGSDDVAGGETGAGLGGAGVSNGQSLKASDPSLSSNESTVPEPSEPEDVDPWQKYEDMAMYALMAGGVLLMLTKYLADAALKLLPAATTPIGVAAYLAARMKAMIAGYAAIAAAAVAIFAGFMMFSKYEQKMMGGIYMAAGAMIIWQAYQAMAGMAGPETDASGNSTMTMSNGDKFTQVGGKGDWVKVTATAAPAAPVAPAAAPAVPAAKP